MPRAAQALGQTFEHALGQDRQAGDLDSALQRIAPVVFADVGVA
jgi:hypothetical protein